MSKKRKKNSTRPNNSKKIWLSERLHKYIEIRTEPSGLHSYYISEGASEFDVDGDYKEFVRIIKSLPSRYIPQKIVEGFILEMVVYLILRARANIKNGKHFVKRQHTIPKSYIKWFGTKITKTNIDFIELKNDGVYKVSNDEIFIEEDKYSQTAEEEFALIEDAYEKLISLFITNEKNLKHKPEEAQSFVFNEAQRNIEVSNLYGKIVMSIYFSMLHLKTTVSYQKTKEEIDLILQNRLDIALELTHRRWMWMNTKNKEDLPFTDVPFLMLKNDIYQDFFIPICRTVGIYIYPSNEEITEHRDVFIPTDKLAEDITFYKTIDDKIKRLLGDSININFRIYFNKNSHKIAFPYFQELWENGQLYTGKNNPKKKIPN